MKISDVILLDQKLLCLFTFSWGHIFFSIPEQHSNDGDEISYQTIVGLKSHV